ncbi:glycosyltransferase family 2 protein [Microvirga sp. TS319]|uniref:glycosyltransferase n=1 Tax=Microvirga sp. TS319 TaxID=3241165 RepID=UPI003519F985
MSESAPQLSVVIPTHNRLPELRRCLDALAQQDFPNDCMEVVVVADGCTDGTVEALSQATFAFPLRLITQSPRGAAAARNRGAREASGTILLFLDDDVIATATLISEHNKRHADGGERVVIGPYLPNPPTNSDYTRQQLYLFWRQLFDTMAEPNHKPSYRDVVSGNLSMSADTFERIGGFDEAFPSCGMEDYELGIRLLENGIELTYAPDAGAEHLDTTDMRRSLQRKYREGSGTITLVSRHPAALRTTALIHRAGLGQRLAFRWPRVSRAIQGGSPLLLDLTSALRLRPVWIRLNSYISDLAFWQGVRDEVGGEEAFVALVKTLEQQAQSYADQSDC